MKKFYLPILALVLSVTLTACGNVKKESTIESSDEALLKHRLHQNCPRKQQKSIRRRLRNRQQKHCRIRHVQSTMFPLWLTLAGSL